jgi:hypothetical protein
MSRSSRDECLFGFSGNADASNASPWAALSRPSSFGYRLDGRVKPGHGGLINMVSSASIEHASEKHWRLVRVLRVVRTCQLEHDPVSLNRNHAPAYYLVAQFTAKPLTLLRIALYYLVAQFTAKPLTLLRIAL